MGNLSEFGLKEWVYADPPTFESMWFEKLDGNELRYWTKKHLPHVLGISFLYLVFVVWLGPLWMKNRQPFKLQKPLVIWNFLLAVFSIIGSLRILPEFFQVISGPNGFYRSICIADNLNHQTTFWGFLFTLSKVFELGDTVFIVLRKKPLIFLHWYHHFTMSIMSFYVFPEGEPYGRYLASLNFFVHSIMYSYYTIKALHFKVPKSISMMVTTLQILQFIIGLVVNAYTASIMRSGDINCFRTDTSVNLTIVVGSSYLLLFMRVFYNSYIAAPKAKQA